MAGRVKKRLYYKIGEACKMVGIQPYVLRYWETEFPALNPGKSKSGQRVYGERELELIRRIQQLLYEEGYTIAGAKKKIETEPAPRADVAAAPLFVEEAVDGDARSRSGALDSASDERIESLRRGVADALRDARAILSLLGKSSR
jgi:DNA-binding transcriptional MerR regulator